MQFARDAFIDLAAKVGTSLRLIGPPHESKLSMPAPGSQKQHAKQAVEQNIAKVWFLTVVVNLVVSVVLILATNYLLANVRVGIAVATIQWAVVFGWFFAFFVPAKIVSAVFGALLGSGTHNLITGSGFVTATQGFAEKAGQYLKFLPAGTLGTNEQEFISWMVWLFLALLTLFCLPALFRE